MKEEAMAHWGAAAPNKIGLITIIVFGCTTATSQLSSMDTL